MNRFKVSMAFLILILIFLLNTKDIYACMCGHSSISDAYAQANAVVTAKVEKIEESKDDEISQSVSLKIEKSFKGTKQKKIKLSQINSTCRWAFDATDIGESYLFYLSKYKDKITYSVIACGRSKKLSEASDDLSWLSGLPNSLNRTRISGVTSFDGEDFPSLAGVKLKIIGKNKTFEVVTDQKGLYEIWDVEPGIYSAIATIPNNFILGWTTSIPNDWTYFWSIDPPNNEALKFTIKSKKCGGVDFMFKRKNDEK